MKKVELEKILTRYKEGKIDLETVYAELKFLPYEDLGFAKVDHHRLFRQGFPEVVYAPGKGVENLISILGRLRQRSEANILVTRVSPEQKEKVCQKWEDFVYEEKARCLFLKRDFEIRGKGKILIFSAGTSDIPVAEEARLTAELMGNEVQAVYDVGVAGLHRLLPYKKELLQAEVIIVVAGMEGALASVIGGMVAKPIIAVPTSVGYGANLGGIAPLLTMLNSCAGAVLLVNIDNGFRAGYSASLINRKKEFN